MLHSLHYSLHYSCSLKRNLTKYPHPWPMLWPHLQSTCSTVYCKVIPFSIFYHIKFHVKYCSTILNMYSTYMWKAMQVKLLFVATHSKLEGWYCDGFTIIWTTMASILKFYCIESPKKSSYNVIISHVVKCSSSVEITEAHSCVLMLLVEIWNFCTVQMIYVLLFVAE